MNKKMRVTSLAAAALASAILAGANVNSNVVKADVAPEGTTAKAQSAIDRGRTVGDRDWFKSGISRNEFENNQLKENCVVDANGCVEFSPAAVSPAVARSGGIASTVRRN